MIITIDGPAASGKSTIAKELAKKLGYFYFSSGFLYRAFAYWIMEQNIDATNSILVIKALKTFPLKYELDAEYNPKITVYDKDVTNLIMEENISSLASSISQIKEVRDFIFDLQHKLVENKNSVVDGRDCGTKVFPYADIKFFLTASIDARAERLCKRDNRSSLSDLKICKELLKNRDEKDQSRTLAPLKIPENAILIDSTDLKKEETLEKVFHLVNSYINTLKN